MKKMFMNSVVNCPNIYHPMAHSKYYSGFQSRNSLLGFRTVIFPQFEKPAG
jgi:hypothetical protein